MRDGGVVIPDAPEAAPSFSAESFVTLRVNAAFCRVAAGPSTMLLDVLRDVLQLTGAKPGCDSGDCGACLVLLGERRAGDGRIRFRPANACLLSVAQVSHAHVVTIEGLNQNVLTPVQQSLVDEHAIQCGYCTPGIAVALTGALLDGVSPASAVSGQLCRCTGYAGIQRACASLATAAAGADATPSVLLTLDDAVAQGLLREDVAAFATTLPAVPAQPLAAALAACAQGALLVGGGTDLWPANRHAAPTTTPVLCVASITGVGDICRTDGGGLWIGAAVTVRQLMESDAVTAVWPTLPMCLADFGTPAVRASATVGGNLCNAAPAADLAVLLLAMDARVDVRGADGSRELSLADFFADAGGTVLAPGELVLAVTLPPAPTGARLQFVRATPRAAPARATVNLALCVTEGDVAEESRAPCLLGLAAGGVHRRPLRLPAPDMSWSPLPPLENIRAWLSAIESRLDPPADTQGSAAYRRALLRNLLLGELARWLPALDPGMCLDAFPDATPGGVVP